MIWSEPVTCPGCGRVLTEETLRADEERRERGVQRLLRAPQRRWPSAT